MQTFSSPFTETKETVEKENLTTAKTTLKEERKTSLDLNWLRSENSTS